MLKKQASNTIRIALLLLFLAYFGSTNLFYHSHIINGSLVTHSHPYSGEANQHTHSTESLFVIHLLGHFSFLSGIMIFIGTLLCSFIARIGLSDVIKKIRQELLTYGINKAPPYQYI
jgi:hypothetical protein